MRLSAHQNNSYSLHAPPTLTTIKPFVAGTATVPPLSKVGTRARSLPLYGPINTESSKIGRLQGIAYLAQLSLVTALMLSSFLSRGKNTVLVSPAMRIPAPPPVLRPLLGLKTIADASLDSPRKPNCVERSFITAADAASSDTECEEEKREEEEEEEKEEEEEEEEEDGKEAEEEEEQEEDDSVCWAKYGRDCRRFPPPILLPRVLKRVYEAGGRLVIREVRVEHQQYLRARRRNGRLTLQLVELGGVRRGGGKVEECEKVGSGMPAPAMISCSESVCGQEVGFEKGHRLQLPVSRMKMVVQN